MDDFTRPNRLRLTSLTAVIGFIAVSGLVLSGCGGSSKSSSPPKTTTSAVATRSRRSQTAIRTLHRSRSISLGKTIDVTAKT